MNQEQLVKAVAKDLKLTNVLVNDVLLAISHQYVRKLAIGDTVVIPYVGRLKYIRVKARRSRNPRTGESILVPAKDKLKFTAYKGKL